MLNKLNELPNITLSDISSDIVKLLEQNKIEFKSITEAPWWIRAFSNLYKEPYLAYKNALYVGHGHVALATSKNSTDRIIATSKLLPWAYAIKNNSVSSVFKFLQTMLNVKIRGFYFLYEFSFLKAHDIPEIPDLIAIGFLSSRRNILGYRKDPDKVARILKSLLANKINKES